MANFVTFQQVRELASRLPAREQLQLVAAISADLSVALPDGDNAPPDEETRRMRERAADEILAECDAVAEQWQGEFDAAEEIRQMRAARDEQIWPSK